MKVGISDLPPITNEAIDDVQKYIRARIVAQTYEGAGDREITGLTPLMRGLLGLNVNRDVDGRRSAVTPPERKRRSARAR